MITSSKKNYYENNVLRKKELSKVLQPYFELNNVFLYSTELPNQWQ